MAIDSTIAVRRAMLTILKANAALTAIVPALRIYPQTTPALPLFPFIRMGAPSALPISAVCVDGSTVACAVHAFAKDRLAAGAAVETAEDYAGRIGAAVAKALDRQAATIPGGKATIRFTGSQLLMDPEESGCFHAVVSFTARAITA